MSDPKPVPKPTNWAQVVVGSIVLIGVLYQCTGPHTCEQARANLRRAEADVRDAEDMHTRIAFMRIAQRRKEVVWDLCGD